MHFRPLILILLGCSSPEHQPCELSDASEVSFDDTELMCVQIEMAARDFRSLGKQFRFGRNSGEQFGGVIGHMASSCTEPFPDPFTYFPAQVSIGALQATEVGVRKKGFVGSVLGNSTERPSLKLKTNKFVEGQLMAGTERITLNNNMTDASRMRTCLTYKIFAQAGYPAPQCNLANVMVNGTSLGVYTHVEAIKKRFLRRTFGNDDGSLYEATVSDFSEEQLAEGLGRWEAKTDDSRTDNGLLIAVTEALLQDNEALEAALEPVLDIDMFIQFWALETLVAHGDGYAANSNNSYIYFDPDREHRGVFIPWGADDALQGSTLNEAPEEANEKGSSKELSYFVTGAISRRLSQHPELHQLYLDRMSQLLDEVWDEEALLLLVNQYAELIEGIEVSEEKEDESEAPKSPVDVLRFWLSNRHQTIEQYIDSGGVEGAPGPMECFPDDWDDFGEFGELAGTVSHSCSALAQHSNGHWLLVLALLGLTRRLGGQEGTQR